MAGSSGRCAAEELVRSISKDHGYLGESVYAEMKPEVRQQVQEAMFAKDRMIGASVILLARELYSKDVRFIFELLQNADDNWYVQAYKAREDPWVAFQLHRDRVVVECNEDGFEEANLRAICTIGKSSKVGGHGYIGEKGIGFKSVFKVAWKVFIQSGDYSFTFTHRPNDIGMGMISPEWENGSGVDGKPDAGRTRITLYLHQDSEADARYEGILQQLNDLDNRMLLFLKKLRHVDVHIYDENDEKVSSTVLSIELNEAAHRAVLKKCRTYKNSPPETTQTYCHVTKHVATGLAKSANRTYTAEEEAAGSYGKAEVILAFPLTTGDVPIIEAQQVFAFLPIRRLGFKFLIQTDFVTMANREDVVSSAPRNIALLDGIAEAFIKAVHEMYHHKTLRYQWMRYLSEMKTHPWDDFWKRLVGKITTKIEEAEIIEPRRRGAARFMKELRCLPDVYADINGDPLFEDLPGASEIYVSTDYSSHDLSALREYGLPMQRVDEFIERVKYDLTLASSRMKDVNTDANWQTRAAIALNYPCTISLEHWIAKTKELCILPLTNGRWVAANDGPVYFPALESGISIPSNIGLKILSASACANSKRVELFKNLGVCHAAVKGIRARILTDYTRGEAMDLEASRANLVFLYQTCTHQPDTFKQYSGIKIYNAESESYSPARHDFYFPCDDPFSPWQLSLQNKSKEDDDPLLEFLSYINSAYLDNAPEPSGTLSWHEWLEELGVRRRPRLVTQDGTSLTPLCTYVAEEMRESFLGFLQYAWVSEGNSVLESKGALEELQETEVLCNGENYVPLETTYLPLPNLQASASELLEEGEEFPFLWLGESPLDDGDLGSWLFLKRDLGVGFQDDSKFYTEMLVRIQPPEEEQRSRNIERHERVVEIYSRICSRIAESKDRKSLEEEVRRRVCEEDLVYIPGHEDDGAAWVLPSDCLLDAPRGLRHKLPIAERYKNAFPRLDLDLVDKFFQKVLGIASYSWEDTIHEIRHLKDNECSDFDLIHLQYKSLDKARRRWVTEGINTKNMREEFETGSLIFVQNGSNQYHWVQPSRCLWSSAAEITDRTSLNTYYDNELEDFFVKILGVPRLDVNMVYDELLQVQPGRTTERQAKDLLWQMNAFLMEGEKPTGTSENLLQSPIFPVRYANSDVKLCSGETQFAIVDRRPLEELFKGKLKLLDFRLGEVHKLKPFLWWAGLRDRLLSNLVREISVVEGSGVPVSDPSRNIARKAHALTRVAVHLRSPRAHDVQGFYDLLFNAKTMETGGISSQLTINQDGANISVEQPQSEVLIREEAEGLKIYVPDNEDSLEVCFGSSLPKQLVTWMVTHPTTQIVESTVDQLAITVVTSILATRSATAIHRILEKDGIIDANIPNLHSELEVHADAGPEAATPRITETPSPPAPDSERLTPPPSTPFSTSDTAVFSSGITTPGSGWARTPSYEFSFRSSPTPHTYPARSAPDRSASPIFPPPAPEPSGASYARLVAHVQRAARATTTIPAAGTASHVTSTLPPADRDGPLFAPVGGWAATDREKTMVGAAGELFAFELLQAALFVEPNGASLSREVWQTPIRALVAAALDDYADMERWPREERADLVFDSAAGATAALVDLLVRRGYLGGEWADRPTTPTCYIEVKATMGPCGTPFFMSDAQYRKMRELTTDESIYLIFRVFNMGNMSIGARIYMDPAQMEQEGLLKFTADRWTVTPGQGMMV